MATDRNVTNIGLLTGSGGRLRKFLIWTGSSKTNTKGNIIRAASRACPFQNMFSLCWELCFILWGFLLFFIVVSVCFIGFFSCCCLVYLLILLFPQRWSGAKWLFLVIEAPSFKLSPPSFNSSCINELFWNFSQKHLYFVLDKHLPSY